MIAQSSAAESVTQRNSYRSTIVGYGSINVGLAVLELNMDAMWELEERNLAWILRNRRPSGHVTSNLH